MELLSTVLSSSPEQDALQVIIFCLAVPSLFAFFLPKFLSFSAHQLFAVNVLNLGIAYSVVLMSEKYLSRWICFICSTDSDIRIE
jgi:hypothetical protein